MLDALIKRKCASTKYFKSVIRLCSVALLVFLFVCLF